MTPRARALAGIVSAAFLLRLVLLLLRGDYIVFDEGYYLLLARSLREHQAFQLNGLPHVALSPLQPVLVALLSFPGLPDLWVSRLLGAACGALLAVPVWFLTERIGGRPAALPAAVTAVAAPSLMSYLPFFPGQSWNLYFGSEPLFVLLAAGACALAQQAAAEPRVRWFLLTGVACALAFLTRAEGVVLGPLVFLSLGVIAVRRGHGRRAVLGMVLAAGVAMLLVSPYLLYLRSTLGRWAFSGRVQAAATASAPVAAAPSSAQRGGAVLEDFVWGGGRARFTAELYGLTPDGRRMQSQYWGVDTAGTRPAAALDPAGTRPAATRDTAGTRPAPAVAVQLWRAMNLVVPWWLMLIALIGLLFSRRRSLEMLWLAPVIGCSVIPVLAAYVEPRSLLPLVIVAAVGAALFWSALRSRMSAQRSAAGSAADAAFALLVLGLAYPVVRDAARASGNDTPLQQLASAQRAVGDYLTSRLPADAAIMSWHPAIAIWARRDWRVMPEAPTEPLLRYAAARRADVVVFSRFHPSPLGNTPKPFTILLVEGPPGPAAARSPLALELVDESPLMVVGRLPRGAP